MHIQFGRNVVSRKSTKSIKELKMRSCKFTVEKMI